MAKTCDPDGNAMLISVALTGMILSLAAVWCYWSPNITVSLVYCYKCNTSVYAKQTLATGQVIDCLLTRPLYPNCIANAALVANVTGDYPACREKYLSHGDYIKGIVAFSFAAVFLLIAIMVCVVGGLRAHCKKREKSRDELALEEARNRKPYVPNEDA